MLIINGEIKVEVGIILSYSKCNRWCALHAVDVVLAQVCLCLLHGSQEVYIKLVSFHLVNKD